jgi:hypothetical protein
MNTLNLQFPAVCSRAALPREEFEKPQVAQIIIVFFFIDTPRLAAGRFVYQFQRNNVPENSCNTPLNGSYAAP